jgi:hypothetical protein
MFRPLRVILLTGLILAAAFPLSAQSTSSQFKYQVTPYFWMTGIEGDVGALGGNAHVDESFGDIWDNLRFGAMGAFEAKWDRWVFLGDVMYINQQVDDGTPEQLVLFDNATVNSKMLIVDPEFGYRLLRRDSAELNLLAGIRYWRLKNELAFVGPGIGPVGPISLTETRNWVDPIVGLQFRGDVGRSFYVTAKGDIGGFSAAARLDWQAFGGVGYRFSDRYSGIVGYRVLGVDYSKDGFLFDTTMKGIVAGVGIRF